MRLKADEALDGREERAGPRERRQLTEGCRDPRASTYADDPLIIHNNAYCSYDVLGCTYSLAVNYLAQATADSGHCDYWIHGCTIATGTLNYDSLATAYLEGSCRIVRPGCTDSASSSYAPSANTEDGSCTYSVFGCTDRAALNYDSIATVTAGCVSRIVCAAGFEHVDSTAPQCSTID